MSFYPLGTARSGRPCEDRTERITTKEKTEERKKKEQQGEKEKNRGKKETEQQGEKEKTEERKKRNSKTRRKKNGTGPKPPSLGIGSQSHVRAAPRLVPVDGHAKKRENDKVKQVLLTFGLILSLIHI